MRYIGIVLPYRIKNSILAVGAQSKGAFCLARGNIAYLSDSSGDLTDVGNFRKFEQNIKALRQKLKIKPGVIVCDLHPDYISTKYASRIMNHKSKIKNIQHHEAHIASCMADNGIKGKVIGIAFDGTGFGRDGNIWGGEFFVGGVRGFKRAAYLKYVSMPGGEACVREPWRMAFSYLYSAYGNNFRKLLLHLRRTAMTDNRDILFQMINKKINSPLTSSMGRLFDGVSSLIGVCDLARYEGEAAIKLEKIIPDKWHKVKGEYKFNYLKERDVTIIDWRPLIKGIVRDLKNGVKKSDISLKFHNAICGMIRDVCIILRRKHGINKVCMSGGVFQNSFLKEHAGALLETEDFEVFLHKNTPSHDGSIPLGQAVLAEV